MDLSEEGGEADPQLTAAWIASQEMATVDVQIFANGDPAGTIPGGSGMSGSVQFSAPGWPETEYTAGWIGTTVLNSCTVTNGN